MPCALAGTAGSTDSMLRKCPCEQLLPPEIKSARVAVHTLITVLVQYIVSHVLRLQLNLHECGARLQMRRAAACWLRRAHPPTQTPCKNCYVTCLHVCVLLLCTHPHALCVVDAPACIEVRLFGLSTLLIHGTEATSQWVSLQERHDASVEQHEP